MYATGFNPATGGADVNLLDLHAGLTTVVDSQQQNFGGVETFTADSKFGMYFNLAGAAVVTNRFGVTHQISDDNTVFRFQATTGSVVAFADHPVVTSAPANTFQLTTGDLHVIDAGRPNTSPARGRDGGPRENLVCRFGARSVESVGDHETDPTLQCPGAFCCRTAEAGGAICEEGAAPRYFLSSFSGSLPVGPPTAAS